MRVSRFSNEGAGISQELANKSEMFDAEEAV